MYYYLIAGIDHHPNPGRQHLWQHNVVVVAPVAHHLGNKQSRSRSENNQLQQLQPMTARAS